jgi:hypothetical protein
MKTLSSLAVTLSLSICAVSERVSDGVSEGVSCEGGYCTNDAESTLRALRNDLWWLMEKHNCNPLMMRLAFHVSHSQTHSLTHTHTLSLTHTH